MPLRMACAVLILTVASASAAFAGTSSAVPEPSTFLLAALGLLEGLLAVVLALILLKIVTPKISLIDKMKVTYVNRIKYLR